MFFRKKINQNNIIVSMKRDSVCMGDDCMAPNQEDILFKPSDTLIELLEKTAKYVPLMHDYEWEVMCGTEVLGRLLSGAIADYQIYLERQNTLITDLKNREVYCRIKSRHGLRNHN